VDPDDGIEPGVGVVTWVGSALGPVLGRDGAGRTTGVRVGSGVILTGVTGAPLPTPAAGVEPALEVAGPPGAAPDEVVPGVVELEVDPPPKGSWKLA
jgi:hypothetical protein